MSTAEFTKYMIAKGLKELLETTSFDNISVGSLAQHCHVSRNTIYYHFRDKYDIVSWIFYSEITPIISEPRAVGNWTDSMLALCRYMQKNKDFYIKVLCDKGQNSFYECLIRFCDHLIRDMFRQAHGNQVLTQEQIKVISSFYAFGLTGMITDWASNGMKKDPEIMVKTIKEVISGEIFDKMLSIDGGTAACPSPNK